jgi:branched-chain amino acid transport system substrate-binding protein
MRRGTLCKVGVGLSAGVLAMAMAGCGSSASSAGDTPSQFLLGGLWATSGPDAIYGQYYTNASKLAVADINAKGGIGGKVPIKLEIDDTQAQPRPAVTALQKLMGKHANAVLSSFSSQTLALMPIANRQHEVVVNGGAQGDALGKQGKYLLNTIPLLGNESTVLAKYLYNVKHYTKAAVIYTSDDGGTSARDDFVKAFEADGGQVVAQESGQYQGTDYRSQLTKLRSSGAQVLMIGAFGEDTNNIVTQAREIGWDVPLANTSWAAIPAVLKNPAASGMTVTSIPFHPSAAFVAEYKKAYGTAPTSPYIGNYYDAVQVLAQAYGKALQTKTNPNGDDILAAIDQIGTFASVYGSPLSFKDGVASRPIDIGAIRNGAVQVTAKNYAG